MHSLCLGHVVVAETCAFPVCVRPTLGCLQVVALSGVEDQLREVFQELRRYTGIARPSHDVRVLRPSIGPSVDTKMVIVHVFSYLIRWPSVSRRTTAESTTPQCLYPSPLPLFARKKSSSRTPP